MTMRGNACLFPRIKRNSEVGEIVSADLRRAPQTASRWLASAIDVALVERQCVAHQMCREIKCAGDTYGTDSRSTS